jgi:hypothetical protein
VTGSSVDVTLTGRDFEPAATLPGAFTYTSTAPVVTGVSPGFGDLGGGPA